MLISSTKVFATEVYKSRVATANQFKNYSMCRSNYNDGFIYCGNIKNSNGVDKIHILRTDNQFNTIWSYMYETGGSLSLNSTKIVGKVANEYWISGYIGTTTSAAIDKKPFIMKIDDNGNQLNHTFGGNALPGTGQENYGVFLDVEPTADGGCVAVRYYGNTTGETGSFPDKRGVIMKFSSTLALQWTNSYHDTGHNHSPDGLYYDVAENVIVVGNEYFVTGSISYKYYEWDINNQRWIYDRTHPSFFYAKFDASGNNSYARSRYMDASAFNACYDASTGNDLLLEKKIFKVPVPLKLHLLPLFHLQVAL